jgi:hypothetical protein
MLLLLLLLLMLHFKQQQQQQQIRCRPTVWPPLSVESIWL